MTHAPLHKIAAAARLLKRFTAPRFFLPIVVLLALALCADVARAQVRLPDPGPPQPQPQAAPRGELFTRPAFRQPGPAIPQSGPVLRTGPATQAGFGPAPQAGFAVYQRDMQPRSLDGRLLLPPDDSMSFDLVDFVTPATEPLAPEFGEAPYARRGLIAHKDGFFQKVTLDSTLVARDGASDVGFVETQLFATFALPMPSREMPLLITPGFRFINFDGPVAPDLPGVLYDSYLHFMWLPQLNERLRAIVAVSPGVYSDFQNVDSNAIRITGRGAMQWDWVPERWQVLLGIEYLDRDDVSLLPIAGLIWTPSDAWRFDLVFPKPKLAMLVGCSDTHEDWLYLAGEFGGGSWSITRDGGAADQVVSRDYRLLLGMERKFDYGAGFRLEAGYVFGRAVEYGSGLGDFSPGSTLLARAGFSY